MNKRSRIERLRADYQEAVRLGMMAVSQRDQAMAAAGDLSLALDAAKGELKEKDAQIEALTQQVAKLSKAADAGADICDRCGGRGHSGSEHDL